MSLVIPAVVVVVGAGTDVVVDVEVVAVVDVVVDNGVVGGVDVGATVVGRTGTGGVVEEVVVEDGVWALAGAIQPVGIAPRTERASAVRRRVRTRECDAVPTPPRVSAVFIVVFTRRCSGTAAAHCHRPAHSHN